MQKQWQLDELVTFMKANKVTRVKLGGLEVDLAPAAFVAEVETPVSPAKPDVMPTDQDLMFWSSPALEREEPANGQA